MKFSTVILVFFFHFASLSQWDFIINNVVLVPENPIPTDEVKVAFKITTYVGANYIGNNLSFNGQDVLVTACFQMLGTGVVEIYQDTISLGVLSEGFYNLQFKAYSAYLSGSCTPPDDSGSVDLSFIVSATNSIEKIGKINSFLLYPNPSNSVSIVEFFLNENSTIEINVIDLNSQVVCNLVKNDFDQGKQKLILDFDNLADGIYFLEIAVNGEKYFEKFVRMK